MNYILKSKKNSLKLANHNIKLKGLSVKGNKYKNYDESIITICDKDMINAFIKKKLNKRVQKLIAFMIGTLNDPDSTDSDANLALDEANKLKGILFNKYKEHMKIEEYKEILSKIFMIEEEFRKNYNQKMFINRINYVNNINRFEPEESMASMRGR